MKQFRRGGMARMEPFGSVFSLGIRNSRVLQLQKNIASIESWVRSHAPSIGSLEGHKWFSSFPANKNLWRTGLHSSLLVKSSCLPPCIWDLSFMLYRLWWHGGGGVHGHMAGREMEIQWYTFNSRALFLDVSLPRNGSVRQSEGLFLFCPMEGKSELLPLPRNGSERNSGEFASIFDPRNGIPSCFLLRGRVRNGIPRVSIPRNSRNSVGNNCFFRLFRLPRNYFFVGNSQP
jgi:hypothetical protein